MHECIKHVNLDNAFVIIHAWASRIPLPVLTCSNMIFNHMIEEYKPVLDLDLLRPF